MSYYKNHIFICTNQKSDNKQCCANHNAAEMLAHAKQYLGTLGITKESKCRISTSGCMGRCELGPVVAVYPKGEWYSYNSKEDIEKILSGFISESACTENLLPD